MRALIDSLRRRILRTGPGGQPWTEQDQRMLVFYRQFIQPGELAFDVGANVGNRTKVFLALKARIVAVEPQAACLKRLHRRYGAYSQLTIVPKLLGASEGSAGLRIANVDTLSSVAPDWVEAVQASGRFSSYQWQEPIDVAMTTMDQLIDQHGRPAFIKIDVEGYEQQVLEGLSHPVPCLSFEFAPESMDMVRKCIDHLQGLGAARFNYSLGESMAMALEHDVRAEVLLTALDQYRGDISVFGDVYCKMQ